jgi:ATP-binding cassette, subfamily C, bacterial exporter for protease/lipase
MRLTPIHSSSKSPPEFRGAILKFRRVFYSVGAFSFVVNLLLLVPAVYMLQVYDRVLTSRNDVTLYMLTFIMIGLLLLEAALESIRAKVLIRTSSALDMDMNRRVFEASFERYLTGRNGQAAQALGDVTTVRQFLTGHGLFAFFDAPWTPVYVLVIFLLSPWLGLFAIASALILLAIAYANERMTGPLLTEAGRLSQAANSYAGNTLRNAEVIEAMGMLPHLRQRWLARQLRFLALQGRASDRAAVISAATRFFRIAFQSCILGFGALLVIENQLTAGGMIAASILLGRALAPVELAVATWRGFVSARAAYHRLEELLAAHPPREERLSLPRPQGVVTADNMVMAAPGSREPILKGLAFRIPAGSLVAVVGPSASGKSTLARALVGVWGPMAGAVRLDGADVHKWNKTELGPWIGYLPQDVELFDGTIADNIARFGEIDSARIVQAAQRAGVHELVLRMPQGYETPIGEGGSTLSGGQRQRIALARALYGTPALVVLDEPNANLDEAGDAALITALRALKQDHCTAFVMTHRINVLAIADAVMVLAGGTIQSLGPRDAVMGALRAQPKARPEPPNTESATHQGAA